jgi:hypothetical protein
MTDFVAALENAERAQLIVDLKAARAELAKGWYQGGLTNGTRLCAVGALNVACCGGVYRSNGRRALAYIELRKRLPDPSWALAEYNDAKGTTQQDVLDLFDKTLAELGGLA